MQYTAAQRLDRLPESAFHRRLAALIGFGLFFDAFDLYMTSGVMVALTASGWSDMASNGRFVAVSAFGALIGAAFAGWLGDRYGRRFCFQFNLVLFAVMSLAAAFAPSMDWLIVLRFIMSIGLGAEIVVGYASIAEFVPPKSRGKWGAILFFLATSALLGSALASYWVIPNLGWRWMFGIAGVGGLVVWVLRKKMPESPRWLESVGRNDEASAILDRIEAEIEKETGIALPMPEPMRVMPPSTYKVTDLFKPPLLRSTILGITMNVVGLAGVYGFIIWLPTFLVKQGLSVPHSLGYTVLITSGSLIGILLASYLSDRFSRKRFLVVNGIIAVVLGLIYPNAGSVLGTAIVGFLLLLSMYVGGAIGFSTYVPELFPTELRLRGCGISSVAGRAASVLAPLAVGSLFAWHGVQGVTLTLVGLFVLQVIVVAVLGFETTGHKLDDEFYAAH